MNHDRKQDIYLSEPESSPDGGWLRKRNRQACKRPWGYKSLLVSGKSKHGERLALDIYKILEDAGLEGTIFPGADPNRPILQLWKERIFTEKRTVT